MADETPLVPPRPDPHDPGMEARVRALESIVSDIRDDLKAMRQELANLKQDVADLKATMFKVQLDLAEVKGRTSQMPTLIQLVTVVIAIWGMAFATLRFAGH
jgi:hypothetical protein